MNSIYGLGYSYYGEVRARSFFHPGHIGLGNGPHMYEYSMLGTVMNSIYGLGNGPHI